VTGRNSCLIAQVRLTGLTFLLGVGVAAVGLSSAHAYVPPSSFQVKTFIAKHKDAKNFRARSTLTGKNDETSGAKLDVHTFVDYTARMIRVRFMNADGVELAVHARSLDATDVGVGGMLLLESLINPAVKALKDVGVPIRVEAELAKLETEVERRAAEELSLKRWNKSVFWVIGRGEAQLWTLKDSFLPMRLIYKAPEGMRELRFETYKYTREFPYPRKVTLLEGESIFFEEEVTEVQVSGDAQATKSWGEPGLRPEGESASSEVKALMRRYTSLMR
jgi:hypothetical protein